MRIEASLQAVCRTLALLVCVAPACLSQTQASVSDSPDQLVFDASQPVEAPETGYMHLGGRSADGHELAVNSQYLVMDGKPWLPVMGEFHFSRYPQQQWEDEIAKMKAGGIDVISLYIFWIHHEEIKGQFDWSGQRDLRRFIQLCAKHRMYVYLRVGPWAHGEARNGGFPDWLLQETKKTRTNDPIYLQYVTRFFNEIGKQTQGLLWKDNGPVIGVQIENEYGLSGPGAGAEHIQKLKDLAVNAGLVVPLWSVTGWPSFRFPPQETLPMLGGYPDGFWMSSLKDSPPKDLYLFSFNRITGDMGAMAKSTEAARGTDPHHYLYGEAEAGAGMETAYHRRPLMQPDDIAAWTLTGIGSGVNLYGYYMFHGGANPQGRLTTLQESQKTGYPNDLPVISYDFQAPLGEFGQERKVFRQLKSLNMFLNSFGSDLAQMPPIAPDHLPRNAADADTPRAAVRSKDGRGFLFVNNYVRQMNMPEKKSFQVTIHLAHRDLKIPEKPITVPANSYFIWPWNLSLGTATLRYSTAQLLTRTESNALTTYIFFAVPGIAPEFVFNAQDTASVESKQGTSREEADELKLTVTPGKDSAIIVHGKNGQQVRILVLTEQEAEDCWNITLHGRKQLLLSGATVLVKDDQLHLRSTDPTQLRVELFSGSSSAKLTSTDAIPVSTKSDGLWTNYAASLKTKPLPYQWKKIADAGTAPEVRLGTTRHNESQVAEAPDDTAWSSAATWKLTFPAHPLTHISEVYLQLHYTGDVGRAYIGDLLADDNFYNGTSWEIGLDRFLPALKNSPMEIRILPLRVDAPIYLDKLARRGLPTTGQVAKIQSMSLTPEYEVVFSAR